ncbi:MAG: helix-turn-helix transcriptional regulator [Candidatus Hydrogenedentes bacterium]|nr:helix-turn-helix transcriptional regulator [Candidatus Hydrogenedentota bacterium]
MTSLNRVIGKVLADRRRASNMSQETLAFECGLHPTYISQVERGLKSPTMRTMFQIASVLETPLSEVIREVEKKISKK